MAAPFKLVHNTDCSANPTLHLPLSTTVSGTLTVNGLDVGATLASVGGAISFTDMVYESEFGGYTTMTGGTAAAWGVANGRVYLVGDVQRSSGSFGTNSVYHLATLPTAAQPSSDRKFIIAATTDYTNTGGWCHVTINTAGQVKITLTWGANVASGTVGGMSSQMKYAHLDGISYAP
jgi:hypothetical protein